MGREKRSDGSAEPYRGRASDLKTWSGLPLEAFYRPANIAAICYETQIGDPGEFPFTRGIHRDMYRGRYWTQREVTGFGTPEETNARLKFLLGQGAGGLNVIPDNPSILGLDSDHPRAEGEVGLQGVPMCTIEDMERLLDGIPVERVSMSLIASSTQTPVALAQYIAVARGRGLKPAELAGTTQNDPIHCRWAGFRISSPVRLALKTAVDVIEYCTRHMPRWYPINVNLYDLREQGVGAAQEIAFGFALADLYIQAALERGLKIDDFAPRFAFYCSAHIDFFEEIAKLRAARRLWAKRLRDRYGAKNPESLKFRFGVHTAGCSLVAREPLNNIVRVAYEAMAAVLAGVQSLHCCSYDEPIALPTEASARLALRTQQILAYETGVARVADPLGGSYFLESLTGKIEEEILSILDEIEARGGMARALETGWIDGQMEEAALRVQREIEEGHRIVVGLNQFAETEDAVQHKVHRVRPESQQRQVERVRLFKARRDEGKVKARLRELRSRAEAGEKENLIPVMIEAAAEQATLAEILGTVRIAMGESYDPLGMLVHPFF